MTARKNDEDQTYTDGRPEDALTYWSSWPSGPEAEAQYPCRH